MTRIKIDLPEHFAFSTLIPVRISDINYGGHVGNDSILSIIHEARLQFLKSFGWTEMNFGSASLIMSDVGIEFKGEAFYGDILHAEVVADNATKVAFDLYYRLTKKQDNKEFTIALAKTGMVCFDYKERKVCPIPDEVRLKLFETL